MSILVVGSVALDTVETPFKKVREVLGGSATYFSVAASVFNPVNLVAVVGSDFPKKYIDFFQKRGVNTGGLSVKKGKTFRWGGRYDWDFGDPQSIFTRLGVLSKFEPDIPEEFKKSEYVFLANIDPDIQEKVLGQVKNPRLVAADTMDYWIRNSRKKLINFLKKTDIFLLNESEARKLTCEANLLKAGRAILKMGASNVVIKKGENGVLSFSRDGVFCAPAFLLESIYDPTGAGDTFAGGLMGYLAGCRKFTKADFRNAVICGIIMSTFAVEDFSLNALSKVNTGKFNRRLDKFKDLISF